MFGTCWHGLQHPKFPIDSHELHKLHQYANATIRSFGLHGRKFRITRITTDTNYDDSIEKYELMLFVSLLQNCLPLFFQLLLFSRLLTVTKADMHCIISEQWPDSSIKLSADNQ